MMLFALAVIDNNIIFFATQFLPLFRRSTILQHFIKNKQKILRTYKTARQKQENFVSLTILE